MQDVHTPDEQTLQYAGQQYPDERVYPYEQVVHTV
jgi:hypothetical protein